MKQLNVKLTSEQYATIKRAVEAQLPRVSLQSWVSLALERSAQQAGATRPIKPE